MPWQTMKHQEVTPEVLARRQQAGMAMKASLLKNGFPEDRVDVIVDATIGDEIWLSDKYQVAVRRRTGQGPFDATEECFNADRRQSYCRPGLENKRHKKCRCLSDQALLHH